VISVWFNILKNDVEVEILIRDLEELGFEAYSYDAEDRSDLPYDFATVVNVFYPIIHPNNFIASIHLVRWDWRIPEKKAEILEVLRDYINKRIRNTIPVLEDSYTDKINGLQEKLKNSPKILVRFSSKNPNLNKQLYDYTKNHSAFKEDSQIRGKAVILTIMDLDYIVDIFKGVKSIIVKKPKEEE
jgi:hypothetical protein